MNELAAGSKKTPYEVQTHMNMRNIALASMTKTFGWNARLLFQEEALEYYLIYRNLKFEKFKIELRTIILNTLNDGIERAGTELGFNAKILVTGLPTLDDVQNAYNHLQQGDMPFGEVLEPFQGY